MRERNVEESILYLLKYRIIEEVAPDQYAVSEPYQERFKKNVRKVLVDPEYEGSEDVYGLALVLTLGQMVYPDVFCKNDVSALLVIHQHSVGLT